MGLAFVDRSGALSPAEQLRDVEDLARNGRSVIVAPEGTRSADGTLGPFKRGAFRIAMATGLPIIPIVVRNGEVLGSSESKLMRAGHVEVAVLPPEATTAWKSDEISDRVEEVRDQFVRTLADWPA
jgi:putative phosphoserine phosphatase/1-acylglycerol-3-phosphate O-acyltransferase